MKLSIVIPVYNEGENILLTLEEINKIHAPIGLNISSKTPQEIALSIMAEITQVRRSFWKIIRS